MMTDNQRIREIGMHPLHQLAQRTNLLGSARISGIPCRVKPALIADADGVLVVSCDVGTHLVEPSASKHLALSIHPEVIPDALPSLRLMVGINLLNAVMLVGTDAVTMQYNESHFTHGSCLN